MAVDSFERVPRLDPLRAVDVIADATGVRLALDGRPRARMERALAGFHDHRGGGEKNARLERKIRGRNAIAIFRKLGVTNRTQAAMMAVQMGVGPVPGALVHD